MQLLEEHHVSERNVAFYADHLFLTPKHVSKVILEVSGKTPTQWIDEYVVLEAKSLLKYANLNDTRDRRLPEFLHAVSLR